MPANKGTGKFIFIAVGAVLLIALIILLVLLFQRNKCPKEVVFDFNPTEEITTSMPVVFTDKTLKAKDWNWDFGDNTAPDHTSRTTHQFHDPGTYTVTLTVNKCASGTKKITIKAAEVQIIQAPKLTPTIISPDPATLYVGKKVTFRDDTKEAKKWDWYFENGKDVKSGQEVTYIFTSPGDKTVQLVVNDSSNAASITFKVKPQQVAATPGPHVAKKLCPDDLTDEKFKHMCEELHKQIVQPLDFAPYVNSDMTIKINVNGASQQFGSFLKGLLIEQNPKINSAHIERDPGTGCITNIIIDKN